MWKGQDSLEKRYPHIMINSVNIKWNNSKGISVVIQEQQKGHALKMIGRHIEIMGLKRYPRY
jgi:hypothetical protein